MTDLATLGYMLAVAFAVGWFFGSEMWVNRRAKKDAICPVCLASTDSDGIGTAYGEDDE